jgi:hypothetical protein
MGGITRKSKRPTLRNTYGYMTLPKGLILYHNSTNPTFDTKTKNSMIFFTFHPSEWQNFKNETLTTIRLNKPLQLFFMVEMIRNYQVFHLLNVLTNKSRSYVSNLDKQYDHNLQCYIPYLEAENLDGWFSSVEGKSAVEIALINRPDYFTVLSSGVPQYDCRHDWFKTNFRFPIYTQKFPIKLHINLKFKEEIEKYAHNEPFTPFQIVLENAQIEYFDKPIKKIVWSC